MPIGLICLQHRIIHTCGGSFQDAIWVGVFSGRCNAAPAEIYQFGSLGFIAHCDARHAVRTSLFLHAARFSHDNPGVFLEHHHVRISDRLANLQAWRILKGDPGRCSIDAEGRSRRRFPTEPPCPGHPLSRQGLPERRVIRYHLSLADKTPVGRQRSRNTAANALQLTSLAFHPKVEMKTGGHTCVHVAIAQADGGFNGDPDPTPPVPLPCALRASGCRPR